MNKLPKFHPELEEMFKLKDSIHVYAYDMKNNILGCNETQLELIGKTIGLARKEIMGSSVEEVFKSLGNTAEIIMQENEVVLKDKAPKQFRNIWIYNGFFRLELLTIKIPMYGSVNGVFGISQYINKFSTEVAFKLGLSKRQIECLTLFLSRKSNKEIARLMNISTRTVEDYFDSLKCKFNCYHKSELINKVIKNNLLIGSNNMNVDLTNEALSLPTCSNKLISTLFITTLANKVALPGSF